MMYVPPTDALSNAHCNCSLSCTLRMSHKKVDACSSIYEQEMKYSVVTAPLMTSANQHEHHHHEQQVPPFWILDSGASMHIMPSRSDFKTFELLNTLITVH